jgi:hypothetical protein
VRRPKLRWAIMWEVSWNGNATAKVPPTNEETAVRRAGKKDNLWHRAGCNGIHIVSRDVASQTGHGH